MLKILSIIFLLLLAHAFSERVSAQGMPLVRFQSCYDGDTCTTTHAEKVRLACIDAPERKKRPSFRATRMQPTAYDNSLADQSAFHLRRLVLGRLVSIRRITTDRYGRTVAELFIDNTSVGQQQVENGHAVISQRHAWQCAWAPHRTDH